MMCPVDTFSVAKLVAGRPLGEQLFHVLAGAIVSGELAEGERINDESIARHFQVSRMPVREALQRLDRLGLVQIMPSRRTVVTVVTEQSIREALSYAGYEAGVAVHAGLPRCSPDERIEAEALVRAVVDALDEPARASKARRDLYAYFSERAGNELRHAHMIDMEYVFERTLRDLVPSVKNLGEVTRAYADLGRAILDGDNVEAERLARALHGIGSIGIARAAD